MKRPQTLTSAALIALLSIILPLSVFGKKAKYVSLQLQKVDTMLTGVSELTAYDKYGRGMGLAGLGMLLENPAKETKAYNCKIDFRTGECYPILDLEMAKETAAVK